MRLQKQLNINNTYRVLNLNFYHDDPVHTIVVKPENEKKIYQTLQQDRGKGYRYLIKKDSSTNLRLNALLYKSNGSIWYYTKDTVPFGTFLDIGSNRNSFYLYELQDFNKEVLDNMNTAMMVSTVAINVAHVDKDFNSLDLIYKLNDVRFIADRVYLDFNKDVSIADKERIFDELHEVLARWTIQLYIKYNDEDELQQLKTDIINKYN